MTQELNAAMMPPPDPAAVAFLQRGPAEGVRAYVARLEEAGLFAALNKEYTNTPRISRGTVDPLADFVDRYEHARFADQPLTETQFRDLIGAASMVVQQGWARPARTTSQEGNEDASDTGSMIHHFPVG